MEEKERHGCVTTWLILMIIANGVSSMIYLFASDLVLDALGPEISYVPLTALALIGFMNIYYAVMLFQWKEWAFWGFGLTALLTFGINIVIGVDLHQALFGLVGIGILWLVLQIRKNGISSWQNLE